MVFVWEECDELRKGTGTEKENIKIGEERTTSIYIYIIYSDNCNKKEENTEQQHQQQSQQSIKQFYSENNKN